MPTGPGTMHILFLSFSIFVFFNGTGATGTELFFLTKSYHGTSINICCCSRRGKNLRLHGGADQIRSDFEDGSVRSILSYVTQEQNLLLQLFSNLDQIQRKFYDPSSIDSWVVLSGLYEAALASLTDRINRFSEDAKKLGKKLNDQMSKWNDSLQGLAHLQTLR
jgi:hypothetical protein